MSRKMILLVEDDKNIYCPLSNLIKDWGYDIILAYDGKDGLAKAKEQKPDLIILDLQLPKLPGEEVCRQIRSDESTQDIPIIMQTGKITDTDRIVGRVIGADCYLTKPYDVNDLLAEITRLTAPAT